jgi:Short C-terminal domain
MCIDDVMSQLSKAVELSPGGKGGRPRRFGYRLGQTVRTRDTRRASGEWWPAELGSPNGTGAQNQVRYAYFNQKRRLAVELHGQVTVYNTLNHQIGSVSQQQGRGGSLTLTSQHGIVSVSTLPVVWVEREQTKAPESRTAPASEPFRPDSSQETDLFAKIERLAELHKKGILSSEEFAAKKAELLSRL